ncbi:MAG: alginate lyase family protein [Armatimonadota bacterium]
MSRIVLTAIIVSFTARLGAAEVPMPEHPMTDAELFAALNLDREGLDEVREAVAAEDFERARRELTRYYRARTETVWQFGPHDPPESIERAEQMRQWGQDILAREGGLAADWREDGSLDWWSEPNRGNKPRMYFWSSMASAYFALGRPDEMVHLWTDVLRSWVAECPIDSGHAYWNGMVAGIRMRGGWPDAFQAFIGSDALGDDDVTLFLKSLLQQARFVRENHWPTGNQLAFAMVGLYTSGVVFPEFSEAADWLEFALQTALDDIEAGYLPDGMGVELSPGYHAFFYNYLRMHDLAGTVGRDDDARMRELVERCERLYEPYVALIAPDGTMPRYQDGQEENARSRLAEGFARYPHRADFQFLATAGEQGRTPEFSSIAMPYAGYIAMRSGWESDANYLGFDVGPIGWTHAHQDKLNVVMWAWGRPVLMEVGRGTYDRGAFSMYGMDTFSHNTALVDGRPQRRAWRNPNPTQMPYQPLEDFRFEAAEGHHHAAGVYDGSYGMVGPSDSYPYFDDSTFREGWVQPATHHRRVLFVEPDIFVIADTLTPLDGEAHAYELRWHLDSAAVVALPDGVAMATADEATPNLLVAPLLAGAGLEVTSVSAQDEPELLGWKFHRPEPEPATTVRQIRRGEGVVRFVTLLLPLRTGQEPPEVSARWAGNVATLDVGDGRVLRVTVPDDPAEDLAVDAP